ncbi:MAG: hypothetical protein AAGA20_19700 [Planctomycetota bacterium]
MKAGSTTSSNPSATPYASRVPTRAISPSKLAARSGSDSTSKIEL